MLLLAIDPGETIGWVALDYFEGNPPAAGGYLETQASFAHTVRALFETCTCICPDVVVVEDYRIYATKAMMHTGRRLYTTELIGAIRALCILSGIRVVVLPASKKGRWSNARLRAKFPGHGVEGDHALDALKLGLTYIEQELAWIP